MGTRIIKQPNGKYALWSSIVDDFTHIDCEDAAEIIDIFLEESRKQITEKVNGIVDMLDRGEKPYHPFTRSFDDCIAIIRRIHGKKADSLKMLGLIERETQ